MSPSGTGYGLLELRSFRAWGCMVCTDYGLLRMPTWRKGASRVTVVTVGEINGGYNFNIIADKVTLKGTTRAYTQENRQLIKKRLNEIISGTELTFGCKIELDYKDGYPPTINNENCANIWGNMDTFVLMNKLKNSQIALSLPLCLHSGRCCSHLPSCQVW